MSPAATTSAALPSEATPVPSPPPEVVEVETPHGPAHLHVSRARCARLTLAVGHGAGGGVDAPDLLGLATQLPTWGITVLRVEQPWRVAGRRVASPPPQLDRCWTAALEAWDRSSRPRHGSPPPLVVGGRSAGARVACRTAEQLGAVGVVALAFPLHPPGRPTVSRLAELGRALAVAPVLAVQGERDPFGGPQELPSSPRLTVHAVAGADHALRLSRTAAGAQGLLPGELPEVVADVVRRWCLARVR